MPERYDDGGISGGTMDRPALRRLLQDVREHKIDVVVVYKIDRLTRSLMDFSRIVEVFDASNASFVSVTQQFNTTTSMGRLTLNVLLSFAQFEREVTAERIRDKIAASRKKGMWMGGRVPIGYQVLDRKLVVEPQTAAFVRSLFDRYLQLGSVSALAAELQYPAGISAGDDGEPELRLAPTGLAPPLPDVSLSRGKLYYLISNPIYVGKLRHRDRIYEGEHQGIIEPAIFDRAQALLADKAPERRSRSSRPDVHLLTGLVFDDAEDRLRPTHASNHGRRYRYYVSHRLKTSGEQDGWRLPAGELERLVIRHAQELLRDRPLLARWVQEHASADLIEQGLAAAEEMEAALRDEAEQRRHILATIFQRIVLSPARIRFVVRKQAVVQRLLSDSASAPDRSASGTGCPEDSIFTIDREIAIKRRGVERRIVIYGPVGHEPDAALTELVARAHLYLARLCDGSASSIAELASELGVHRADISRILPLAFLSPAITGAILTGTQPADITARTLSRLVDVPPSWNDQSAVLGMGA